MVRLSFVSAGDGVDRRGAGRARTDAGGAQAAGKHFELPSGLPIIVSAQAESISQLPEKRQNFSLRDLFAK
jgi:hypothetical protein